MSLKINSTHTESFLEDEEAFDSECGTEILKSISEELSRREEEDDVSMVGCLPSGPPLLNVKYSKTSVWEYVRGSGKRVCTEVPSAPIIMDEIEKREEHGDPKVSVDALVSPRERDMRDFHVGPLGGKNGSDTIAVISIDPSIGDDFVRYDSIICSEIGRKSVEQALELLQTMMYGDTEKDEWFLVWYSLMRSKCRPDEAKEMLEIALDSTEEQPDMEVSFGNEIEEVEQKKGVLQKILGIFMK